MATVLGINTSHDSSVCSMTDGKIDFYHEEARWCRDKHFVQEKADQSDGKWLSLDYAFNEAQKEYDINTIKELKSNTYDSIIITVAHQQFVEMGAVSIRKLGKAKHILYDLKYALSADDSDMRL